MKGPVIIAGGNTIYFGKIEAWSCEGCTDGEGGQWIRQVYYPAVAVDVKLIGEFKGEGALLTKWENLRVTMTNIDPSTCYRFDLSKRTPSCGAEE